MTTNLLVIEDEPAIQELLRVNLRHHGFEVACVASAEAGMAAIRAVLPDLLMVDWMLPGQSGLELVRKLRADERTRDLPILMLTARVQEESRVEGLEVGADDYVSKPFSPKELVARVRALLRRRAPHLAGVTVELGRLSINPETHRVRVGEATLEIGPTEFRLLLFFMTHPERVHTRAQLLDEVWGDHVFIEERTVDVHIRRLRLALEGYGEDGRIETVRGAGYRFLKG